MNNHITDTHTRTGTIGGLLSVFLFTGHQVLTTTITAATGAIVSFGVSMLCKYLLKQWSKRHRRKKSVRSRDSYRG